MSPVRRSLLIWVGLIGYLVLAKLVLSFAATRGAIASQNALFLWPQIAILALVGGVAVWVGPRTELPGLWDSNISTRERLLRPALIGLGVGALFLALSAAFGLATIVAESAKVSSINVAFPDSLVFYSAGAIIVETMYRLIPITLPLWLIGNVLLRKRGEVYVFWTLALLTSMIEPLSQLVMLEDHTAVISLFMVGTFAINIFEAHLFRRFGFLAPLGFRIALYVVWHMIGGALGY